MIYGYEINNNNNNNNKTIPKVACVTPPSKMSHYTLMSNTQTPMPKESPDFIPKSNVLHLVR
jgi:hypothetical protein